jgi:hypothetical protein
MVLRLLQGLAGAGGVVVARAVVRDLYSGALVMVTVASGALAALTFARPAWR